MRHYFNHTRIYRQLVDILDKAPVQRKALVEQTLVQLGMGADDISDRTVGSYSNNMRSRIGAIINEMYAGELIGIDELGRFYLISSRPVMIRIERCEKEILKAITEAPITKSQLRDRLKEIFGTAKTATTKDDDTLSTYMGQILKKLISVGAVTLEGSTYSLSPKASARADDINAMLELKAEFIRKIHSKGGEFFENYLMQLLKRYLEKQGLTITECYVTGGASDGGIDGVIRTEDALGFRELILVQAKNRIEIQSETDVRGFYGAVNAKDGTRGIFATTSDIHDGAKAFLKELDDCVLVNGDTLFKMARACSYGIKKHDDKEEIDSKII